MNYTVTAHTGCMNTQPNTIESIITGFNSGADIVEIDVRFDKNNVPVLSHDAVNNNINYATLSQAFDVLKKYGGKKMNIDLKEFGNIKSIQDLAKSKSVLSQIFFTGVEDDFIDLVKSNCPSIPYYLNFSKKSGMTKFESYIKFLIDKTKSSGAMGINLNKESCNDKLIDRFKKEQLLVSLWTVTDTKNDKVYLDMNVDNITCKNPDEVLAYIGKH